jgi:hypothetical protein
MKRLLSTCGAFAMLWSASVASAGELIGAPVYTPFVDPGYSVVDHATYYRGAYYTAPAGAYEVHRPVAAGPVVAYSPVAEEGPDFAYSPVVEYPPVVAYRPLVTYGRMVTVRRPVVAYYGPAVAAPAYYGPAPMYYSVGRPVVVRSKIYVPGQPIRNVLRAVTP